MDTQKIFACCKKENKLTELSLLVDCFGHLFAEYAYRLLAYLLERRRNKPKLPKDYAASMIVEKFGQLLCNNLLPDLKAHYDSEFSRVLP